MNDMPSRGGESPAESEDNMKRTRLYFPKGVHRYDIDGDTVFAEYMGRQQGLECIVCGKGCNAFTFNIIHAETYEEALENREYDYETWGFGRDHIEAAVTIKEYYENT